MVLYAEIKFCVTVVTRPKCNQGSGKMQAYSHTTSTICMWTCACTICYSSL